MSNIVLKHCKEIKGYSNPKIANALGVTVKQYAEIESGELIMTREQSETLGKLFDIKPEYVFTAALQLDSLLVRREVIKIQKRKIDQLETQLNRKTKAVPIKKERKAKTKKQA